MRIRWSGILLGVGNTGEMTLGLLRGVFLARILTPEHFGIGVTLTAVAAVAESVSDVGLAQMAVRADPARVDQVLRTLHTLSVLRGLMIGAILVVAGYVLRPWMGTENTVWAFYVLAASSAVRGFTNLGLKSMQRSYAFGAEAATSFGSQSVWTAVSVLGGLLTRSFDCMVWGALAYSATYALLSQLLARREWRLGWNKEDAVEAARYGSALIPNGIALALINVGDRLIVGAQFGPAKLALYNTSATSVSLPRSVISRYLSTIFIPILVNHAHHAARSKAIFATWSALVGFLAFGCGLGFMIIGRMLVIIVYGARYDPGKALAIAFGVSVCVKIMTLLPVPPALAYGRTNIVFVTSAGSAIAMLLGALFAWLTGWGLTAFVAGTATFEAFSIISIVYYIRSMASAGSSVLTLAAAPILILAVLGTILMQLEAGLVLSLLCAMVALAVYALSALAGLRASGVSIQQALRGGTG